MTTASGTVTYTRDLALALQRRGWTPIVYASVLGPQADVLRWATISVVSDPAQLGAPPDVIHGQHVLETLAAMARFPNVPALFVCHDSITWHSMPPRMPRMRAYVAVDRNCRDRMVFEHGFPADSVRVLTNPVDLERFRRRGPLPSKPRRALVFNNVARENTFVAPIRAACRARHRSRRDQARVRQRRRSPGDCCRNTTSCSAGRCAIEAAAPAPPSSSAMHEGIAGMLTTDRVRRCACSTSACARYGCRSRARTSCARSTATIPPMRVRSRTTFAC
jgi:hypothetical protein